MTTTLDARAPTTRMTRIDVEDFLIAEAALLDHRCFSEWFALFEEGATYEVPQAGAHDDADAERTLFYVADDYFRLGQRVERMTKPDHHSEFPASICSRMISNVRIVEVEGDKIIVECRYLTTRSKNNVTDMFCGHHRYTLKVVPDGFRIRSKTTFIDMNDLRPQGRVSIFI